MFDRITSWLYGRLGARYWVALVAGQVSVSVFIVFFTVAILSLYFDAGISEIAIIEVAACALTVLAVLWAAIKSRPAFNAIQRWRTTRAPTTEATVAAWGAATTLTLRQYRSSTWWVSSLVVLPTCALLFILLDLDWRDLVVVLLATAIPAAYATVLSYSVGELLSRPLITQIAASLPDKFAFERHGLPVRTRIRVGLPTYTALTGVLVASLVGSRDGSVQLLIAIVAGVGVGVALSQELSYLLARAITEPLSKVRLAMARVQSGDLSARVPVTSSDELGELAHDFNLMTAGLEDREQMRETFGTYMDKDVAQLILSGEFPQEGVEVDVSILFCDVRGFTSYAERSAATEVVATLNQMFEAIVPVIDRHGGHVDKFMGDGLLAVFGAPASYADHADRAVAAASQIVSAVDDADTGLRVGVGVNSGPVVAGSIGGAGRLNFSVIGDAVNIAARVEAATRQTGDDVLITAATKELMLSSAKTVSRGPLRLKGLSEPLELFALHVDAKPARERP